jgi:hypothetical protein
MQSPESPVPQSLQGGVVANAAPDLTFADLEQLLQNRFGQASKGPLLSSVTDAAIAVVALCRKAAPGSEVKPLPTAAIVQHVAGIWLPKVQTHSKQVETSLTILKKVVKVVLVSFFTCTWVEKLSKAVNSSRPSGFAGVSP